jgi:dynein heavy chain, axonemal
LCAEGCNHGLQTSLFSNRQQLAQLPSTDEADLFGLHPNAAIAFGIRESRLFLEAIVFIQPRVAAVDGAVPSDHLVAARASELLQETPSLLHVPPDLASAFVGDDPPSPRQLDPFAAVLLQEVQRYA